MSHEIFRDSQGMDRAVYARGLPAWHRLGEVFPDTIPPDVAFEKLFRDLTYVRLDGYFQEPGAGTIIPAKGFCYGAARWQDEVGDYSYVPLVQVKKGWQPIQPRQAFDLLLPIFEDYNLGVEASGILGQGERLWICCRLPEDWDCGGDPHNRYINVHLPLDGCMYGSAGHVRTVCRNTYQFYREFETKSRIRIQHTGNIQTKVDEGKRTLGLIMEQLKQGEDLITAFKETEVPEAELGKGAPDLVKAFVTQLFDLKPGQEVGPRTEKTLERWFSTYFGDKAKGGQERSVKRLFDTTTEFVDWNYKQDMAKESAQKSILFGKGANLKDKAFALCSTLATEGQAKFLGIEIPDALPDGF